MCASLTVYLWVPSLWLDLLPLFDSFLGGAVAGNVSAATSPPSVSACSCPPPQRLLPHSAGACLSLELLVHPR